MNSLDLHSDSHTWSTANIELHYSHANILLVSGVFLNVFLTTWTTRGLRMFSDMTACCKLALGMSVLTWFYFAAADATLVGIGINNEWGRCEGVSRAMFCFYLFMKGYTGVFLFKKLHEMSEMMKPGWSHTTKRLRITPPYYWVFGPLLILYAVCIALIATFTHTPLITIHSVNESYCAVRISNPHLTLPVLTACSFTISSIFAVSFISPYLLFNTHIRHHVRSMSCCFAALIMGMVPFAMGIYMFVSHGHEAASVVHAAAVCDVFVSLCCVWFMEGSWTRDRGKNCKCENPVLREIKCEEVESTVAAVGRLQGEGSLVQERPTSQVKEPDYAAMEKEERKERMRKVRIMHQRMDEDLEWTGSEEEPGEQRLSLKDMMAEG